MPLALLLGLAALQGPSSKPKPDPAPPTSVAATRTTVPPVIDGKDDDAVWHQAPRITQFRVFRPTDGATPKFQTEARVAYDNHNLYVFVRAFDPHPDSIVALLARRDVMTPSDVISIFIDSYHDRRTGYEFDVNPAGVKVDAAIFQDGNEDMAWDGVWEVGTRIDSLGWTAEFRFPLSQLRYAVGKTTFGFTVARQVERSGEKVSWPPYHTSQPGIASQLGELTGLDDLAAPKRTELLPYLVTKNVSVPTATGFDRGQRLTGGADFKVGIASNLTLTGTVNPDFGQVEADPAVLNLTAFESFFPEKRPFFVEGNGLFQFNVNCSAVNCNSEELFYSRRIGRAPQLASGGDLEAPNATTIIGAGKLTGRLPSGFALGVIDAVTQHETGAGGLTVEPATNYAVVRATQDFHNGGSGIGVMFTGVNRSTDSISAPYLHRTAYVGAFDLRHRFLHDQYEVSTSVDLSRVAGSVAALLGTQLDPVHFYQRPDGPLHVDSAATSLSGDAEEVHFGKIGGDVHFESSYLRRSPGFEVNDLGFLLQADQQSWNTWVGLFFRKPNTVYRQAQWNLNWWQWWSAAGLPTERAANTNIHLQLPNLWWLHVGGTLGQLGTTYCDRCARGGPAVRQDSYIAPWAGFNGDDRKRIIPNLFMNYFRGDAGHNEQLSISPQVTINASTQFSASLGLNATTAHADNQWYNNYDTAGTHYTFAHLDQRTLSLTADLGYTVTTTLSIQWHLQPFVSRGTYSNIRELNNPQSASYDGRYKAYFDTTVTNHPGGVDSKQFNSNLVVRWEYRPGSTLFVVWTQGRDGFTPFAGPNGMSGDFRDLFHLHPDNTFLVKVSYWLNE